MKKQIIQYNYYVLLYILHIWKREQKKKSKTKRLQQFGAFTKIHLKKLVIKYICTRFPKEPLHFPDFAFIAIQTNSPLM